MDSAIIQNSITSFMIICVIIVFAQVFMRSRWFTEVYEGHPRWTTQILLILFFAILSVFGSSTGLQIYGAAVNVRDLGAMAAGLICGPYVGIGAGIIGGLFRFFQGGPYMWTGLSAPILSGFLGGILYLANKRQFVPTWIAVLFIGLSETLISCYTLILVTKPAQFYTVVTSVAIPMILFNVIGMFIFASVVHYTLNERRIQKEVKALELEVESKRNLAAIINTIVYPVYVLDRDHRFILVNESFCRFIGKTREEILGHTHRDFYNTSDAERHWTWIDTVFGTSTFCEKEVTFTKPDGQICTLISSASVYREPSGHEFVVAVIQDITERKKMQIALAENEAWYRILFEHTGAATIIINDDGTIDQANSEFMRLSGYSREEIEGQLIMLHIAHKDDVEMIKKYHLGRRTDPASVPSAYTIRIIDKGGETKTLHAVVALIPGTTRSIASFVDISEQKRAEDALTLMNRKLNLLSSITRHDIINQLMILKGFLALLKQMVSAPSLSDFVERSERATLNIERQIIFTRDYQDMGVKAPVWQNLKNTVIAAKGALNLESINFEMNVPDIEIYADRLFEKVFFNLIDNSLKYAGPKLGMIRVSAEQSDEVMIITYRDNGDGIPDKDREHLFERGFGKHTGFGLFLSREILSITGISIEETGREGKGAQFTIRVPKGAYRPVMEKAP